MQSNLLVTLQQCEDKFHVIKNQKNKYYINYDGKPVTLELAPSSKVVKDGFFSFGAQPNYVYNRSTKKFSDELTGDYTIPLTMCKDINNKTEDEQKLEQVLDWIQHAVERDIANHEEMDVDDINVGSIITKSKDPTKSDILNLKNCFKVPRGYKFRKGVQLKASEKINNTKIMYNFEKPNDPEELKIYISYSNYPKSFRNIPDLERKTCIENSLTGTRINGVYYVVFDQISRSNDIWYVQMKLHTVMCEPLPLIQEEDYSQNIFNFK